MFRKLAAAFVAAVVAVGGTAAVAAPAQALVNWEDQD